MIIKVILCFIITEQLIIGQTQSAPNFCDTQHFDGIWNFGPKLQTIWRQSPEQRWLWTYNSSAKTFRDPPDLEPKRKLLKSTLMDVCIDHFYPSTSSLTLLSQSGQL